MRELMTLKQQDIEKLKARSKKEHMEGEVM
jgi:hypothetical protein